MVNSVPFNRPIWSCDLHKERRVASSISRKLALTMVMEMAPALIYILYMKRKDIGTVCSVRAPLCTAEMYPRSPAGCGTHSELRASGGRTQLAKQRRKSDGISLAKLVSACAVYNGEATSSSIAIYRRIRGCTIRHGIAQRLWRNRRGQDFRI